MATEYTWDYSYNIAPTAESTLTEQCRSFFMQTKDYLVAHGWEVSESCDSVAVGGAGIDKWDALTDIVAATGAHSWMVLKSPEGIVAGTDGSYTGDQSRLWVILDNRYANFYQAHFSLHKSAPSGGTTTAAPTSTSQLSFVSVTCNRSTLNTNALFHFISESGGGFCIQVGFSGAGYMPFAFGVLRMEDITEVESSTYDYPQGVVVVCGWTDSGTGALNYANLISTNYTKVFGFDGTACTGAFNALGNSNGWLGADFPSTGDSINNKQMGSQIWVTCETASRYGRIGRLPDFAAAGQATAQGTVSPASGPAENVRIGALWFPTDTAVTI